MRFALTGEGVDYKVAEISVGSLRAGYVPGTLPPERQPYLGADWLWNGNSPGEDDDVGRGDTSVYVCTHNRSAMIPSLPSSSVPRPSASSVAFVERALARRRQRRATFRPDLSLLARRRPVIHV